MSWPTVSSALAVQKLYSVKRTKAVVHPQNALVCFVDLSCLTRWRMKDLPF